MSLLWYDEVINVIQVHLLNSNCATRITDLIIICLPDRPYSSLYVVVHICISFISNLVSQGSKSAKFLEKGSHKVLEKKQGWYLRKLRKIRQS